MKFNVGDKVLVTSGKDKGRKSEITKVIPKKDRIVVKGINLYTKHVKPYGGNPGEKKILERPLHTASIAILNDKNEADRIGFKVNEDGSKVRIFKKTGKVIDSPKKEQKKK
ncbi:MAG: 50S ribosomal protein L24 [Candidatus Pacebacteria bacterium]|nr:50S ribosomal protein L24 [Candidatus Paceibacterota bacterium]